MRAATMRWGAMVLVSSLMACERPDPGPATTTPTAAPTASAAVAPTVQASTIAPAATAEPEAPAVSASSPTAVTAPSQQTYPDVAKPIADDCTNAAVLLSTAPESVGADYPWTWSRQAMLANQQFTIVPHEPTRAGEVSFSAHQASERYHRAWALVAHCHDGLTCNKLAAMYKAIVPGARAEPFCGAWPMDLDGFSFVKLQMKDPAGPEATVPSDKDVAGQCARLQACTVAMDPPNQAGKAAIGLDCQKAPSRFKRECAKKYPCAEVMSCLGG